MATTTDNSATARDDAPSVVKPEGLHLAFLDGVRGLACFYVMFHHAVLDLPTTGALVPSVLARVFALGHYAVDVFIVLSGYCLMLPLLRREGALPFWPFMRRRAIRILPTYYAAMGLSLLLIATLVGSKTGANWDASLPVTRRDIVLHLLVLHEWSTRSMFKISSPFWSIGVEWKIYFLMPAMFALSRRFGAARMAAGAVVLGYAAWLVIARLNVLNPSPYGSSPHYVGLFAMGMWAADLSVRGVSERAWAGARWLFYATTVVLAALTLVNEGGARVLAVQFMSGIVGFWAALGLALLRAGSFGALRRAFSWRPAVFFGQLGYTIYLIHAPIAQFVCHHLLLREAWSDNVRALTLLPIYLACTLAVAIPFYRFFERPLHALSRRWGAQQRGPALATAQTPL